jgi:hypothetical protein
MRIENTPIPLSGRGAALKESFSYNFNNGTRLRRVLRKRFIKKLGCSNNLASFNSLHPTSPGLSFRWGTFLNAKFQSPELRGKSIMRTNEMNAVEADNRETLSDSHREFMRSYILREGGAMQGCAGEVPAGAAG